MSALSLDLLVSLEKSPPCWSCCCFTGQSSDQASKLSGMEKGNAATLGRCWDRPPADLQDGGISKMRSTPKSGEGLGSAGITEAPSARYQTYFVSTNWIFTFSTKGAGWFLKQGDDPSCAPRAQRAPTAGSVPALRGWISAALSPPAPRGDSPERDALAACPASLAACPALLLPGTTPPG